MSYVKVPLDPSMYYIDPRLAHLFKHSTGIQDDEQLKRHILKIQAEAYEVSPLCPIRYFACRSDTHLVVPLPMHSIIHLYTV